MRAGEVAGRVAAGLACFLLGVVPFPGVMACIFMGVGVAMRAAAGVPALGVALCGRFLMLEAALGVGAVPCCSDSRAAASFSSCC